MAEKTVAEWIRLGRPGYNPYGTYLQAFQDGFSNLGLAAAYKKWANTSEPERTALEALPTAQGAQPRLSSPSSKSQPAYTKPVVRGGGSMNLALPPSGSQPAYTQPSIPQFVQQPIQPISLAPISVQSPPAAAPVQQYVSKISEPALSKSAAAFSSMSSVSSRDYLTGTVVQPTMAAVESKAVASEPVSLFSSQPAYTEKKPTVEQTVSASIKESVGVQYVSPKETATGSPKPMSYKGRAKAFKRRIF